MSNTPDAKNEAANAIQRIVSKADPLSHYHWGNQCDGWNLVDKGSLSVKLEKMPPQTAEERHWHREAEQFFYILKGEAVFEIRGDRMRLVADQGIHILAGTEHRIINEGKEDLEFVLTSTPSTRKDRINIT
jgi:mannose-6-phosphate isomerase-like protein (cupin superfamily)